MTDKTIYGLLGERVSVRRKKLGLTQAALASKVGMSRASIANIESGRQNILLHHVYTLAAALELPNIASLLPSLDAVSLPGEVEMTGEELTEKQRAQLMSLAKSAMTLRPSIPKVPS